MSSTTSRQRRSRSTRPGCRRSWRPAWLAATSLVLLAGCGDSSGPTLRQADARQLIALTKRVSALHDGCAQQRAIAQVQVETLRLVDAHRVPRALQAALMGGVHALVDDQPTCLPAVAPTTTAPAPPAKPVPTPVDRAHGHGREHGHGRPHGHGPDHAHGNRHPGRGRSGE